ncbi:MAG: MerR family transcriptional regulator [Streptosporangiaceae bacterium]
MQIGELARRTAVPARRIRYYEEKGLLSPRRSVNGYRDYDLQAAQRVTQISGLIDAGIPTAIVKDILPLLDSDRTIHISGPATELIAALEHHREQLNARIQCITRNRDAISNYLDVIRSSADVSGAHRSRASAQRLGDGPQDGAEPALAALRNDRDSLGVVRAQVPDGSVLR